MSKKPVKPVENDSATPTTDADIEEDLNQVYRIDVNELDALGDLSDLDLNQFLEQTENTGVEDEAETNSGDKSPNPTATEEEEDASVADPFALAEEHLAEEVASQDEETAESMEDTTDDEVELSTDDEVELSTDDEVELSTDDEAEFSTDDLEESIQGDNQTEIVHAAPDEPANDTEKLQRLQDRLIRVTADFDNFRKRARREIDSVALYANEQLLRALLPIIDNLERALESIETTEETKALTSGVEMVLRQLSQELRHHGVTTVDTIGEQFDPKIHEAFEAIPTTETQPGEIMKEYQKGYTFRERLLRPAMVSVATEMGGEKNLKLVEDSTTAETLEIADSPPESDEIDGEIEQAKTSDDAVVVLDTKNIEEIAE